MIKKTGVLLINLGTPDSPTPPAIRRFLSKFLTDRRVIEIPRFIWWPILYCLILPFRSRKLASQYKSIWTAEGSPLAVISHAQAAALSALLEHQYGNHIHIELGMAYSKPSIATALKNFEALDITKWIVLPLYPQNSAATVGTAIDIILQFIKARRTIPELHFIAGYAGSPDYIAALTESLRLHWQRNSKAEKLLISFHGLPERNIKLGDPYLSECTKTATQLSQALNLKTNEWEMVFQSRFGRAKWLQPYLEPRLIELAKQGIRTVDVICPGFSADCLETLDEIGIQYRKIFVEAGGADLRYIPALNATEPHIEMMAKLVEPCLSFSPKEIERSF
jgi:ferrochelatase